MKKFRILFWVVYVFGVMGSIQTYQTTYGGSVLSLAGIIDNFIVPLIAAAVIVGLVSLVHRTYLKIKDRYLGKQPGLIARVRDEVDKVDDATATSNYFGNKKSSDLLTVKVCQNCAAIAGEMWETECTACAGTVFTHSQIPRPINEINPEFKICPMCFEKIKYEAKKCRYCQHMLDV